MLGTTTKLRMRAVERRVKIVTTHTRVHLEQADALDLARPASSADTVKLWHQAYKREVGDNAVQ